MARTLDDVLKEIILPELERVIKWKDGVRAVEGLRRFVPEYEEEGVSWLGEELKRLRPKAYEEMIRRIRKEVYPPINKIMERYYARKGGLTDKPPLLLPEELIAEGEEKKEAERKFFEYVGKTIGGGESLFEIWSYGLYAGFTPEEIYRIIQKDDERWLMEKFIPKRKKDLTTTIRREALWGNPGIEEVITKNVWSEETFYPFILAGYLPLRIIKEFAAFEKELYRVAEETPPTIAEEVIERMSKEYGLFAPRRSPLSSS